MKSFFDVLTFAPRPLTKRRKASVISQRARSSEVLDGLVWEFLGPVGALRLSCMVSIFTVHHRGISTCSGKGAASLEMQQGPPRHTLERWYHYIYLTKLCRAESISVIRQGPVPGETILSNYTGWSDNWGIKLWLGSLHRCWCNTGAVCLCKHQLKPMTLRDFDLGLFGTCLCQWMRTWGHITPTTESTNQKAIWCITVSRFWDRTM